MSDHEVTPGDVEWNRPTVFYNGYAKALTYAILLGFLLWSVLSMDISLERIIVGIESAQQFLSGFVQPSADARRIGFLWEGLVETIHMALIATVLGVLISLPVAFTAAENISPRPVYRASRGLITTVRAFHSLILAIIFVKAFGFGPLAGVLTLSVKTIGFIGKLLGEDIEDIDMGQVEAARSTGASIGQIILFSIVPQVMPRFIGLTLYRFDINLRSSTIIGIVGAGGVGLLILRAFEQYEYGFLSVILLSIIGIVFIVELISGYIRGRIQ
jgi:phosphonate transport system permease protein